MGGGRANTHYVKECDLIREVGVCFLKDATLSIKSFCSHLSCQPTADLWERRGTFSSASLVPSTNCNAQQKLCIYLLNQ